MAVDRESPIKIIPSLSELIARGDGTFIFRPRLWNSDLDTWITVREAAKVLPHIKPRKIYDLLGIYLVFYRPLPSRVAISLRSVLAFRTATLDPGFWENPILQERCKEQVRRAMADLQNGSMSCLQTLYG